MGDMSFLGAIAGYAAFVLVIGLFNLIYNVVNLKLELTLRVIGAHFLAAAIAEIIFIIVYVLIFWLHKGAAWWIGCVVASVIGTGVLSERLSSHRR